jgi:hypothetical protein
MNGEQLANLFATTYSPDPNVRKRGELDIRRVRLLGKTTRREREFAC